MQTTTAHASNNRKHNPTQNSTPMVSNLSVRTCYKHNKSALKLGQSGCNSTVLNAVHAQTTQYTPNMCNIQNQKGWGWWGGVGEVVGGGGEGVKGGINIF